MHKFLWIGSYLTEDLYTEAVSYGYRNASSYTSQRNLVEGIGTSGEISMDVISCLSIKGFPLVGPLMMPSCHFQSPNAGNGTLCGYLNLPYINKYLSSLAIKAKAKNWLKQNTSYPEVDIFVYEMRSACLSAALYIKERHPNARIHLIVPDLPIYMDLNMGFMKTVLKMLDNKLINSYIQHVDSFILYATSMVDYLNIRDKKWMLMEGSIHSDDIAHITKYIKSESTSNNDKIIIMYSGMIERKYGIDYFLEAIKMLDERYQAWFTGDGSYAKSLREEAEQHPEKIKYYGYLNTRGELLKLQQQASILINLRNPHENASKYCFPSKLFEYMLTGKAVLSTNIEGIPSEYHNYIYIIEDYSSQGIAEAIQYVNVSDSREGATFIKKNKNNLLQSKRIIEFITNS